MTHSTSAYGLWSLVIIKALVGFQGRGIAECVPLDFWHSLLLEALIFQ